MSGTRESGLGLAKCTDFFYIAATRKLDECTLGKRGRISVPKEIRAAMGLLSGGKIVWTIENGEMVVRAAGVKAEVPDRRVERARR